MNETKKFCYFSRSFLRKHCYRLLKMKTEKHALNYGKEVRSATYNINGLDEGKMGVRAKKQKQTLKF